MTKGIINAKADSRNSVEAISNQSKETKSESFSEDVETKQRNIDFIHQFYLYWSRTPHNPFSTNSCEG
tara:strand:- start:233 stop:436 length:204 start_codon:yes stop_codon:yes gene_type:complete